MAARGLRAAGERQGRTRAVTYCVVPHDLAPRVHELLRRHFAGDPSVDVVVELRAGERRESERRVTAARPANERRRIRHTAGRRVAERRALAAPVPAPSLPRGVRRHAARLLFVERIEPGREAALDADTNRIVTRFQAGDQSAFAELYMRYFDGVYSYLRVALRDIHEAEDATQQVFMQAMEALPRYEVRPDHPFRGWLFRIARNYVLNHVRKQSAVDLEEPHQIGRRLASDSHLPQLDGFGWLTDTELMLFVERLPLAQRQALALKYMVGLTSEEIGKVLDRPADTVRQLQHRALRFLNQRLTAIGRNAPRSRGRPSMRITLRHANVLRARRFALGAGPRPTRR